MRQLYLIIFLYICVLYHPHILGDKKGKLPSLSISPTGNIQLDKILAKYKKEFDEKVNITTTFNQRALAEAEGKSFLLKLLWSLGYYSAKVGIKDSENDPKTTSTIIFQIIPSQQYTIRNINIRLAESSITSRYQLNLPEKGLLKIAKGDVALATKVLEEEKRLYDFIEENNCLMSLEVNNQVVVDYINNVIDITYSIKAGAIVHINKLSFEGLHKVNEEYMHKIVRLKEQNCFSRSIINNYKVTMQKSGLFTVIEPIISPVSNMGDMIDIKFKVKEGAHRTVKAGASYSTDLGVGITAGWEHRNFLSRGEKLNTILSLTKPEKKFDTQFEKPFFLFDNQTLKVNAILEQQDSKAYTSKEASLTALLDRKISLYWTAGAGGKYSFDHIKDQNSKRDFALFSIPTYLMYDNRNDILDPKRGVVLKGAASPFVDTTNFATRFLKISILGSYYLPLNASLSLEPVAAFRTSVGSILGATTNNIPATERFYTGGGSSIRGYGYQLAGPLNQNKDPTGGQSFIENSMELRLRMNKDIGVVAFVDSGNVFDKFYPKLGEKLYLGAGLGIRYYTGFGPLRIDVAIPIRKRSKVDRVFLLYFSIGQAF